MPTIKTCGGSYREVGPYNQTLFLGCSVSSFNMNLGWGADASSITVSLVEDKSHHPASAQFNTFDTLLTSINSPNRATTPARINIGADETVGVSDSDRNLQKTISANLEEQKKENDLGKVYWNNNTKNYWTDPDPGFIGLPTVASDNSIINPGYDLIGAPVYFKFDDSITFGGMISNWKANGSQGGAPTFEVEIKSYASLLGGCQLIIDNYIGSISTLINTDIAVPSIDIGAFNSDIVKGNLPNVFNIFGYLENLAPDKFGFAGKTEAGVSAVQIYYALKDLAGGVVNAYSPYGAIVGKHPLTLDGGTVNVSSATVRGKANGSTMTLKECGLCPNVVANDGVLRTKLKLDLGDPEVDGVPIPPNDLYIGGSPYISILDFISRICEGSGFDFYVDFLPDTTNTYSGIIKIRTVSRRNQPPRDIIKNIVKNLVDQGAKVSSFTYGQEYNDKDVRSMYIGGQQKRLLQVKSVHLAIKQTSMVFDPYYNNGVGSFVNFGSNYANHVRIPDAGNTRYAQVSTDGGSAVGQLNDFDTFTSIDTFGNSLNILRGNYHVTEQLTTNVENPNPLLRSQTSYALYVDLICPYFGVHGHDSTSSVNSINMDEPRKVYLDRQMGQLQVVFRNNDITTILSKPFVSNGEFLVLENEIRAAGAGFEAWFSYCFDNLFKTDIEDLMYTAFAAQYPIFANRRNFLAGLSIINWDAVNKSSATQSKDPRAYKIKIENAQPYVKFLYEDLKKVHSFFKEICDNYYGKQYMVKTPKMRWYRDGDLQVSFGNFAYPGTGKIYTDWEISSDGAWEEAGNFIDDTLIVGSTEVDLFCDDSGKIQPMLGFNACGEFATRDLWSQTNVANRNNPHSLTAKMLSMSETAGSTIDQSKYFYFPLEHSMRPEEYLYVPYVNPDLLRSGLQNVRTTLAGAALSLQTAHGRPIPSDWIYKMYVKCSVDDKVVFLRDPDDTYRPRAIVKTPGIFIGGGKGDAENSLFYVQLHDALLKVNRGSTTPQGGSRTNNVLKSNISWQKLLFAWGLSGAFRIFGQSPGLVVNNSAENVAMVNKATCPAFAAIPVQFNRATYGPWINHPGLSSVSPLIFPGYNNPELSNLVNNLVGGVKVDVDTGLVPWEYGGTESLDAAVMSRIKDDINYQQVTEQGTIQVAGIVLTSDDGNAYKIGSILSNTAGATSGPIVSNFSINIGSNGITATYNMRTYTKKIGFFNKDNSDRIKQTSLEFLKRKRDVNNSINNTINKIKPNTFANTSNTVLGGDTPKPLRWSPFEVLAGAAYPQLNTSSSISNIFDDLGFSPSWSKLPYSKGTSYNSKDMLRYLTNVSVQDIQELPREIKDDYANKSFMSLDGILSPISFYPTPFGSTYNITKYPRNRCPFCNGNGTHSWEKYVLPAVPPGSLSEIMNTKVTVTEPCKFCEPAADKDKKYYVNVSPKETPPPYVLASGDDLSIISRNAYSAALSGISGNPIINYSTLNPILLKVGEFSCFQNRQQNDQTAHSIDLVGFGMTVPEKDNSLKIAYSSSIEKNFLDYDQNYLDHCAANSIPTGITPSNNMRFFGLRGPLMVHGWGYDLEGYPVPNASGEPKILNGEIVKDSAGNIIYKNQMQNPDGTWTKPYKEHSFYKGWGQIPGTWPVGPVDLRWDSNAGVWTVGSNYKPVWVLIETDLVGKEPSRGTVIDDSYSTQPLPSGLRKLVFVKDSLGINPAPRGAPIYCKYNSQNGFYEPIYNKPYITSGIIRGATSVDIYNIYENTSQTYLTTFKNPLDFNVSYGDKGIFGFIGSGWVLQSYKC